MSDDDREQRRRLSSLQEELSGSSKKKVSPVRRQPPPPDDPAVYFLDEPPRPSRRLSHHVEERLGEIPEEVYEDATDEPSSESSGDQRQQRISLSNPNTRDSTPRSSLKKLPYAEYGIKPLRQSYERQSSNYSMIVPVEPPKSPDSERGGSSSRRTSAKSPEEDEERKKSTTSTKSPQTYDGRQFSSRTTSVRLPEEDEAIFGAKSSRKPSLKSSELSDENFFSAPSIEKIYEPIEEPQNVISPEIQPRKSSIPQKTFPIEKSSLSSSGRSQLAGSYLTMKSHISKERNTDNQRARQLSFNPLTTKYSVVSETRPLRRSASTNSPQSSEFRTAASSLQMPFESDRDELLPPPRTRKATGSVTPSVKSNRSTFNRKSSLKSAKIMNDDDEDSEEEDAASFSVIKRVSIQFPVLEEREKIFQELVANGDVEEVKNFLRDNIPFNYNCVGYEKKLALQTAIRNLNEPMVNLLLTLPNINACDAVLTAVKTGNLSMLEMVILQLEELLPGLEFSPCPSSADFAEDLTPLMLAAQEGNFEMVDLLLSRGHRMPKIHPPDCRCFKCKEKLTTWDFLKYSTVKLNQYKAVASPMYLFQTTFDPIQRAFELTGELQAAARMYPQFHAEYEEMWKNLRQFSADFIGCCRTSQEVELVLNQPAGCHAAGALIFPRLQLAIDKTQKEFVAHPCVQAVLESAWIGEAKNWKTKSLTGQILAPFSRIFVLFAVLMLSCCMPTHRLFKKFQAPVNKFISSIAGHIVFLLMIFAVSMEDKVNQKRGPPRSSLKWLIVLFVVGYCWNNFRLCFKLGPKRFFSLGWNWFDCLTQACFLMTFVFWVAAWADVMKFKDENLQRRYWNAYDPTLLAEGLFAIATIMTFLRLYLPMSLNYYVGPLQVSIGKMMMDIWKFVLIMGLLIVAWSAALSKFYQPYSGMVQTDPATDEKTTQVESFVSLSMTLKTFFWAIFGMTPIEAADVIITNINPDSTINEHVFTQGVGYFTFAIFSFIAVILMLNMLVACMANTFTKVIDNVPVEWVFGRTKIYILYMYHSMFPSPLNLIPNLDDLTSALTYLTLIPKKRAKFSLTHCCYIERVRESFSEAEFQKLMTDLAQRYIVLKKTDKDADGQES